MSGQVRNVHICLVLLSCSPVLSVAGPTDLVFISFMVLTLSDALSARNVFCRLFFKLYSSLPKSAYYHLTLYLFNHNYWFVM